MSAESAHKLPLLLATAAWKDLQSRTQAFQAAVIRGDAEAAQRLRHECHDLLDSNLDLNSEVAVAVRAMSGFDAT